MLYWICPECGGECSPAVRECPVCTGSPVSSPASVAPASRKEAVRNDVLALVNNVAPSRPAYEPLAPAAAELYLNGHSGHAALELLEPPIELRPQPHVDEGSPAPQEAIESLVRPLIESAPPAPAEASGLILEPSQKLSPPTGLSEAIELQASRLLDSLERQREAEIRSIVASFQRQNTTTLLAPPRQVVTAPAPPSLQWMRTPRPKIPPVPPKPFEPASLMFGLQTPPLAGPCIPQDLRNLVETQHPARRQGRKKAGLPAWTVSFLVAITLFLGVGSLLQYWAANRDTRTPASPSLAAEQSQSGAAAQPSSSKIVEVTGLRVLAAPNRPRLDFIVVNHSATPLSDVPLKIAVRSSSSPADTPPLFTISTSLSSLGPYQSREFRAELDPGLRPSDFPDWQSLRADVRVTSLP